MLPLQGILSAMRVNAEMQGQQQAKDLAQQQKDNTSKSKLEINPDGTISAKNVDPSVFNGTADDEVRQAAEAPRAAVEKKLRDYGFAPKSSDVQGQDVDTFSERYRARRELGGSVIKSALMAGVTGGSRDEALVTNLKNQRAAVNSNTLQKFVNPIEDQALEADRQVTKKAEERRLLDDQARKQREAVEKGVNDLDFTTLDPSEWADAVAAKTGITPTEAAQNYGGLIRITARTQAQKDEGEHFKAWTGTKVAQERLGTFETLGDAITAYGRPLSRDKREQFAAAWKAGRREYVDKIRAQERADARLEKTLSEKPEKPRKLTGFDAVNASAESLLAAKGDSSFDQTSVEQAIANRRGKIQKELAEITAHIAANDLAFQQLDKQRRPLPPGAKVNRQVEQKIIEKQELGRRLVMQARARQAELEKLGGATEKPDPLGIRN